MRIYLAGKISKNCWRHEIVDGLGNFCKDPYDYIYGQNVFPEMRNTIFNNYHYVGPFFIGCNHGCFHGDNSHGVAADVASVESSRICIDYHGINQPEWVVQLCVKGIERADLVFAWIDSTDCYGTLVEIGYAKAYRDVGFGKPNIWVAGPQEFSDLWFAYRCADKFNFSYKSPLRALENMLVINNISSKIDLVSSDS